MNQFDLKNRTALITGGAQGFGFDIAKKFLNSGANVIIWDIDEKELQNAVKKINNSKNLINKFLDELVKLYGDEDTKLVLGGFSQGAMMALEVGLTLPDQICGLISCSGWIHSPQLDIEPDPNNKQDIYLAHGSLDDIVPIQKSIEAMDKLSSIGYTTQFREYEIAHEISHIEISDISEWLQSKIPPYDN